MLKIARRAQNAFATAKSSNQESLNGLRMLQICGKQYACDDWTNLPSSILIKAQRPIKLHNSLDHPLQVVKKRIQNALISSDTCSKYAIRDELDPVVSAVQNFDQLLVPTDHVSRSKSDTYYVNEKYLLRTHTSAHQSELISECIMSGSYDGFLAAADVYRRDEIDSVHYPVFHQMEGVRLFKSVQDVTRALQCIQNVDLETASCNQVENPRQSVHDPKFQHMVSVHLKATMESVMKSIFQNPNLQFRWIDTYFPFTSPSYELEILWHGKWIEVLGCGVVRDEIIKNVASPHQIQINDYNNGIGWAFGIGLERIAMILFNIPDIRLFWTDDERFHSQFKGIDNRNIQFNPYSKYPPVYKDVSFWTNAQFHENDFAELVREYADDLVENVTLIDSFTHPKSGRESRCYRVLYRSMERNLLNTEIDKIQEQVVKNLKDVLNLDIR
ncbi:hypothetical protein MP228_009721 [Amoeboaphelidium protococcarum]|nr:hypothetical protein MP228_009721 [Amoeboaphelidium protococcarum]